MASVVMADDGIAFDGLMAETAPLGGAETAFVALAEALAARGHQVEARNRCRAAVAHNGVRWVPLSRDLPHACDLYIGNRSHRVIGLVRRAGRRVLWLHNPAFYLKKPRNLWRLAWYRPTLVVTGAYHAATIPRWLPCGGREIIPYGILDRFRTAHYYASPRRRGRSSRQTRCAGSTGCSISGSSASGRRCRRQNCTSMPAVPSMASPARRAGGGWTRSWPAPMRSSRPGSAALRRSGERRWRGRCRTPGSCSIAEIPAKHSAWRSPRRRRWGFRRWSSRWARLPERVIDGVTGRVAKDDDAFVAAAVALLRDDELWRRWHLAALERQRGLSWDAVGARFEALILDEPEKRRFPGFSGNNRVKN